MVSLKQRRKPAPRQNPAKAAGMARVTHKLLTDANEFGGHLMNDLARSVYNAESDLFAERYRRR
jgi:hypothetical protein